METYLEMGVVGPRTVTVSSDKSIIKRYLPGTEWFGTFVKQDYLIDPSKSYKHQVYLIQGEENECWPTPYLIVGEEVDFDGGSCLITQSIDRTFTKYGPIARYKLQKKIPF